MMNPLFRIMVHKPRRRVELASWGFLEEKNQVHFEKTNSFMDEPTKKTTVTLTVEEEQARQILEELRLKMVSAESIYHKCKMEFERVESDIQTQANQA